MVLVAARCIRFFPLHRNRYGNINHGLIAALSERWNAKTSSFHLPVGEITVTLDDVSCLQDIPIRWRLIAKPDIEYEDNIQLLQTELGFTLEEAQSEVTKQRGGYVCITLLKDCFERLLNRCNQLEQSADNEEDEEKGLARNACIKAFLFLFVGLTIFANKNSRNLHLIWLATL